MEHEPKVRAAWFAPDEDAAAPQPVEDCVARIEALKIRMLRLPFADEIERAEVLQELNAVRAAFLLRATHPGADAAHDEAAPLPRKSVDDLEIDGIVGQNPVIVHNLEKIARIAPTKLTMLLEGETGAGKELFARIIHLNSGRQKLVTVNCGAFPPGIIESELFGHTRGAFTGATAARNGKFEEADGGTIFLDEIGDLELQAQVKLLRVLDAGELQRVGSDKIVRVDVRVVAATNRDLQAMVAEGRFREDLFYRLSQCHIWIPPLRERRDEIEILFEYFVKRTCAQFGRPLPRMDKALTRYLFHVHDYPGNIRELKNLAEYIVHMYNGAPVQLEDLPYRYNAQQYEKDLSDEAAETGLRRATQDRAERDLLISVMRRSGGDIRVACRELGLSRSRLYQLFKKHEIQPSAFRQSLPA